MDSTIVEQLGKDGDLILAGIRQGKYSLFTGAGFSCTSRSANGEPIPLGTKFSNELTTEFQYPSGYPLTQLAQIIPPDKLNAVLQKRFCHTQPDSNLKRLTQFIWARIYTVNVDDVMTQLYSVSAKAFQIPEYRTFADPFRDRSGPDELQVIHLHGYVRMPDHGYVFSIQQYAEVVAREAVWFKILADEMVTSPFIFIGASLSEPDLAYYIARRRNYSAVANMPFPSLYVDITIDAVKKAICQQHGLIPIQASATSFLETIDRLSHPRPTPSDLILARVPPRLSQDSRELRIFHRQWDYVDIQSLPDDDAGTKLLEGFEPRWGHIDKNQDIRRAQVNDLINKLRFSGDLHLVMSAPGDGKSTFLKRVAVDASETGVSVFFYRGQERPTISALQEFLGKFAAEKILLIIDDVDTYIFQFAEICRWLHEQRPRLSVVCACRQNKAQTARNALPEQVEWNLRPLSKIEARALVAKMRNDVLLGLNSGKSDSDLVQSVAGQSLLAAIVSLNRNINISKLIRSELEQLSDMAQRVYGMVALVHVCGVGIRFSILQRATGIDPEGLKRTLASELAGSVVVAGPYSDRRESRHKVIADAFFRELRPRLKYELMVNLAKSVAPYINVNSLRQGTPEAAIARILDYDAVVKPNLNERALDFYDDIRPEWEWHSRYWGQRALASLADRPNEALQFALTSVGIDPHLVNYTTLAQVYFHLAITGNSPTDIENLNNAADAIENALESRRKMGFRMQDLTPYHVGIKGMLRFAQKLGSDGLMAIPVSLRSRVREWKQEAVANFSATAISPRLSNWRSLDAKIGLLD